MSEESFLASYGSCSVVVITCSPYLLLKVSIPVALVERKSMVLIAQSLGSDLVLGFDDVSSEFNYDTLPFACGNRKKVKPVAGK